jgi:hypothetical protein
LCEIQDSIFKREKNGNIFLDVKLTTKNILHFIFEGNPCFSRGGNLHCTHFPIENNSIVPLMCAINKENPLCGCQPGFQLSRMCILEKLETVQQEEVQGKVQPAAKCS